MKKKAARRKTAKKSAPLRAKPLREHFGGRAPPVIPSANHVRFVFGDGDDSWEVRSRPRTEVAGVPLPPDLDQAIAHYSRGEFEFIQHALTVPPLNDEGEPNEECGWEEAAISPAGWEQIRALLGSCIRQGFYLALLRYADDLKRVPEAARITAGLQRGRKIAAELHRKQAAPQRTKHRKRFRELRKSGFSKTQAREVIHQETGISVRQLERDTKGLS